MTTTTTITLSFFLLSTMLLGSASAFQNADEAQAKALAHAETGQSLYKNGDAAQAVVELRKAVELQPQSAEYRNQLATAHYHNNEMSEMWKQLRKGAMLDSSHALIAKGMLAYWGMFDKQGLFNVGSELTTVVKVLGAPDHQVTNPQDASRKRLVYGFLAADFRNGKLHETLDLRGLTSAQFNPQETIQVQLDGRGWAPAYRANTKYSATTEWTLPGEKIQKWNELVSIQRLHNLGTKNRPVDQIAMGMMDSLKQTNPDRQYRIIEKDENSILLEWKTGGGKNSAAQHEIVRLFKARRDIHRIAYVKKTDSLEPATQQHWVSILRNAQLKPVTDIQSADQPGAKQTNASDRQMWMLGRFLSVAIFAHARKQKEVAKSNLVQAFRRSQEIGLQLPKPFQQTDSEIENVSRAVDYLVNQTPQAMRQQGLSEDKVATYQLITRTFALAMLAADKDLVEKSMVMIRKAAETSALPSSLIAALDERTKAGATPDQIRGIIQKLHADAEFYFQKSSGETSASAKKASRKETGKKPRTSMAAKIMTLANTKRAEITDDGEVWINGNKVGDLTSDGEIWVNGNKEGDLTKDGEVWKAGNKIGSITSEGEAWLMGNQIGSIEANGDVWMSGNKIGSIKGANHRGAALIMFFGFYSLVD